MKDLQLVKRHSKREGYEQYIDLLLVYEYNGKQYEVRIYPSFKNDYAKLYASAKDLDFVPSTEKDH